MRTWVFIHCPFHPFSWSAFSSSHIEFNQSFHRTFWQLLPCIPHTQLCTYSLLNSNLSWRHSDLLQGCLPKVLLHSQQVNIYFYSFFQSHRYSFVFEACFMDLLCKLTLILTLLNIWFSWILLNMLILANRLLSNLT